jgi:UDPglucose 6-dehydrogenase
MKVGIVGYGWVGKAMHKLFPEALIHDSVPTFASRWTKEQINECDIAFVCVPTPAIDEGKLDTSIVEEVIVWCECPFLVIRSTVNPGDCDKWIKKYNKKILYQPEFLGETPNHPLLDPKTRQWLVIGGQDYKTRRKLIELYTTVYNANITIRQLSLLEAEIVKLSENRAISFKVAQIQELYDVCEKADVDFYVIREAVYGDDSRFDLWWSFIFPDKRGFQSKCLPKDVYAWCAWAESLGYKPEITRAILEKNKEWIR